MSHFAEPSHGKVVMCFGASNHATKKTDKDLPTLLREVMVTFTIMVLGIFTKKMVKRTEIHKIVVFTKKNLVSTMFDTKNFWLKGQKNLH